MATDLERLTVELRANISQFDRQMQRARQTMDRQAKAIESRWAKTNRNLSKLSSLGLARAGGAVGGALVAGFSVQKAQQLIDSATRINNALRVAGLQGQQLEGVYQRLFNVAQKQGAPIEDLVDLYGKLAIVQRELGVNSEDLVNFTDNVAAALKVAGTNSNAARGALTQLSQALGGGTVRAEEFNSILEGAPTIAQAVARGLKEAGGSVARLRQLVVDGKVSSQAFFRAFEVGSTTLQEQARNSQSTIGQAYQRIENALINAARKFDDATDVSGKSANALNRLAGAIDVLGDTLVRIANGPLGQFIGKLGEADQKARDLFGFLAKFSLNDEIFEGLSNIIAPEAPAKSPVESERDTLRRQIREKRAETLDLSDVAQNLGFTNDALEREIERLEDRLAATYDEDNSGGPMTRGGRRGVRGGVSESAVSIDDFKVVDDGAKKLADAGAKAADDIRKSLLDTAQQFQGFREDQPAQRGALKDFFKAANQNVDPKITAWCAAFVNAVLATNGLPGTGRLNARSFLDYGTPTQDPQPGDLVILKRGSGNVQGHVGFFMGNAEGGGVRVLGGNQGDAVNEKTFRSEDVLGFRQVPGGASEGLAKEVELRREQLTLIRETMGALAEETAGISAETTMLSASNAERERERVIRETLNELQRQGVTITDEVRAAVEAEANARYGAVASYDAATEAAERLRQKQEELAAVNQEIGYAFGGAVKGLISDLVHGKDATEALYNSVSRLADRLLDIALDQVFASLFGGGLGGTGLFGGLLGFDRGGYTGNMPKSRPAGVVHGREFVVNAEATKKNRALLEAINAGMSGYAEGGYVIPRVGGKAAAPAPVAASGPVDVHVQNINTFDAQAFLSQALSSQAGVKTILNAVRAQPGAFKAAMNG